MAMKHIFQQAKDKNVRSYVIYGDTTDSKLYYSTGDGKVQVTQADLQDAFKKNMLIINDGTNLLAAVKVKDNKAYTLAMTGEVGSQVMSFVEWTAVSAS